MIDKIILNLNDNPRSTTITWNAIKGDYIVDIPNGIERTTLIELVDEIKRITEWED